MTAMAILLALTAPSVDTDGQPSSHVGHGARAQIVREADSVPTTRRYPPSDASRSASPAAGGAAEPSKGSSMLQPPASRYEAAGGASRYGERSGGSPPAQPSSRYSAGDASDRPAARRQSASGNRYERGSDPSAATGNSRNSGQAGLRFADQSAASGPELTAPGSSTSPPPAWSTSQADGANSPESDKGRSDERRSSGDRSRGGKSGGGKSGERLPQYGVPFEPPARPVTSEASLPHRGSAAAGPLRPLNPPTNIYGLDNQQNIDDSGPLWDRESPSLASRNSVDGQAAHAAYEEPPAHPVAHQVAKQSPDANARQEGASLAGDEPQEGTDKESEEQPWTPLILTSLALFASLGGNGYLAWIAWGFYTRYMLLVGKLREER